MSIITQWRFKQVWSPAALSLHSGTSWML